MTVPLLLPSDLTPEEAAAVEALRAQALARADADAALMVSARRDYHARRREGHSKDAALGLVTERLPLSREQARRMVYGLGRFGLTD